MKIISWNVNGIRACAKKGFLDFLAKEDPEILCLQETKAHKEQLEPGLINPLQRKSFWSSANRKGYSGTATFLKASSDSILNLSEEKVAHGIGIEKFDVEGRFVVTDHGDFCLYNVYFPNGSSGPERHQYKQDFLNQFTAHLSAQIAKGRDVIVLGDYNVAYLNLDVFDPIRLSSVSGFLPEERAWFKNFLNAGFVDSFRHFYPEEAEAFTWWSYQEHARLSNRGWRIDHICVSQGLVPRLKGVRILPDQLGSDHCPIVIELV